MSQCTCLQMSVNHLFFNIFRYMLDNELACDVEFAVGSDSRLIKAHKYMLASRSPVFFAMLFGELATSSDAFPISVPDLTYDAFQVLLRLELLFKFMWHCNETQSNSFFCTILVVYHTFELCLSLYGSICPPHIINHLELMSARVNIFQAVHAFRC